MIRYSVFLGFLMPVAGCGGASTTTQSAGSGASESGASDDAEAGTTENGDAVNEETVDEEAVAETPGGESEAADSTGESEETPAATESAAAEEATPDAEGPPPSDDLQSYVGAKAYTPEYRIVTENMDAVKQCYLDGIRIDPDIQGTVKVRFTVNKAGKVVKAKAVINELNEQVGACVVTAIKKLKFPKRAQKRTVEYPFNFFPAP